jgi:hypothetical protein
MRGDDFDDLVLVGPQAFQEVGGDGQVLVLAVALWQRLVGDRAHEVLQEGRTGRGRASGGRTGAR